MDHNSTPQHSTHNSQSKFSPKLLIFALAILAIIGIAVVRNTQTTPSNNPPMQQLPEKSTYKVTNLIPTPSITAKWVEGQIIVQFKPGVTDDQINQILLPYSAKILRKNDAVHSYVIQVPKGQEDTIVKKLSENQLTKTAEPDVIMRVNYKPNDPQYTNQWGLNNTGQAIRGNSGTAGDDIKAELAWNTTRGNGVRIAVVDSGINLNHPDLAGQIIAQKTFGQASIEDQYGHGTHVAGAIAANGNNGQGVTGVCPGCKLIIAKALDDVGEGDSSNVIDAITWAADQGAKVINISAGTPTLPDSVKNAIDYAISKGSVVVCSAGNDSTTNKTYPAGMDSVVSVAATDNSDRLASFSTNGTWVKVAAPGVDIMSTLPTHSFNLQLAEPLNTTNDYLSGTSMAAPIVSGVLGLIWSTPYGTSNTAVVQRLYSTADKISGTGTFWANGRVNAAKAVGEAPTPTAAPQPTGVTPTEQPQITSGLITEVPTPMVVTPTFTCLGSCPLPTTVPDTATPTPPIINGNQTQPTNTGGAPTGGCAYQSNSAGIMKANWGGNRGGGDRDGGKKWDGGKRGQWNGGCKQRASGGLIQFLLQLLQLLLTILAGGTQAPHPAVTPTPTIMTCVPKPTACATGCTEPDEPTQGWCPEPTPTEEPTATLEPTPTDEPTGTPEPTETPAPSPTDEPTATPTP